MIPRVVCIMEYRLYSILNIGKGLLKVVQEIQSIPWQNKFPLPPVIICDNDFEREVITELKDVVRKETEKGRDQSSKLATEETVADLGTNDFGRLDERKTGDSLHFRKDTLHEVNSQEQTKAEPVELTERLEPEREKFLDEVKHEEKQRVLANDSQSVPELNLQTNGSLNVSQKNLNTDTSPQPQYWKNPPKERAVPASPISRFVGFGTLGMGLAWGVASEATKRIFVGSGKVADENSSSNIEPRPYSLLLSEANTNRLAATLCRMRGAALKLGQMLSIQDDKLLPPQLVHALERARHNADIMPRHQLLKVLETELGKQWSERVVNFDWNPIAAASIGQVHRAMTVDNIPIAMKIQYPGVARSIDSDLENLKRLLKYLNMLPRGMYIDESLHVAKEELKRECDYLLEASHQERMRKLLSGHPSFVVPFVVPELTTKAILTTQLVNDAVPVDMVANEDETVRNRVASLILELTLRELFVFRFMQTDPNFSNFLYHRGEGKLYLLDFGASREYSKDFVDLYLKMVWACSQKDREGVIE